MYSSATATAFPSLYEGFGLPVLESMACGTPIITSDTSSLPEVGGDAAIYINPLDVKSIKNALSSFENNEFDRDLLVKKGIHHAAKYTWNKCAQTTVAVYEKYLGL